MNKKQLILLLSLASTANAATIHYEIRLVGTNPLYSSSEKNLVTITYDETKLTGSGDENLTANDASFIMKFDGKDYFTTDDALFPSFPVFGFSDGDFTGLSFETSLKSDAAGPDAYFKIVKFDVSYGFTGGEESQAHMISLADSVPEPSSSLLVIATTPLFLRRRRSHL